MPLIRCAKCSRWLTPEESGQPCPRCGSLERNGLIKGDGVNFGKHTHLELQIDSDQKFIPSPLISPEI